MKPFVISFIKVELQFVNFKNRALDVNNAGFILRINALKVKCLLQRKYVIEVKIHKTEFRC